MEMELRLEVQWVAKEQREEAKSVFSKS